MQTLQISEAKSWKPVKKFNFKVLLLFLNFLSNQTKNHQTTTTTTKKPNYLESRWFPAYNLAENAVVPLNLPLRTTTRSTIRIGNAWESGRSLTLTRTDWAEMGTENGEPACLHAKRKRTLRQNQWAWPLFWSEILGRQTKWVEFWFVFLLNKLRIESFWGDRGFGLALWSRQWPLVIFRFYPQPDFVAYIGGHVSIRGFKSTAFVLPSITRLADRFARNTNILLFFTCPRKQLGRKDLN